MICCRGLHTRTALARLPLRQLGFLVKCLRWRAAYVSRQQIRCIITIDLPLAFFCKLGRLIEFTGSC